MLNGCKLVTKKAGKTSFRSILSRIVQTGMILADRNCSKIEKNQHFFGENFMSILKFVRFCPLILKLEKNQKLYKIYQARILQKNSKYFKMIF
ncbi:hypothetical protein BpHYR1_043519 [Brachionus plicatilis]|uniref:Uncharacterized protein n=1 Tax=Brachionus plicatilis TaxID=10195 RepID=A0A3M7QAK1_BRAPC|nr:hypothetical protein BpHYR1_043519 [Brachionus plicatilis]